MTEKERIFLSLRRRIDRFIDRTLRDVRVELLEEFDRNFEREAFFNERWVRRKHHDDRSRGLLVRTGTLRRSLRAEVTDRRSVRFFTDVPYARIHNEGGTITVTRRMKNYFWVQYMTIVGSKDGTFSPQLQRKKDGTLRNNKRNRELSDEAAFYKAMALKSVGSKIVIPRRQFIGRHAEVERILKEIAENNLKLF